MSDDGRSSDGGRSWVLYTIAQKGQASLPGCLDAQPQFLLEFSVTFKINATLAPLFDWFHLYSADAVLSLGTSASHTGGI